MAFRGIQTTNIISTDVGLTDPLLILNKDGAIPTDVGFLGKIGVNTYAGLVKDSATDNFLLISSMELSPNTVNDVNALDASILPGNITVGNLTANTITSASLFSGVFADLTSKPTTLAGYGITDGGGDVTASSTDTFTNKSGAISQWTNDSAYITGYTVTQSDVTGHQSALTITESQISDLSHTSSIATLTDVDLTGLADNNILKWNNAGGEWVTASNSTAGATASAILPVAQAYINTESAGTGAGCTWGAYDSNTGRTVITFNTAMADTNYSVITDKEAFDEHQANSVSKTTTSVTIQSLDSAGTGYMSPASWPYSFVIYSSSPTQSITSSQTDFTQASAGTIHASNYTDTNTTYSVGDGGLTEINFTSADNTKLDAIASGATANLTDAAVVTAYVAADTAQTTALQSYTDTAVANLVASAPGTLDTLNELAAALGDDPNFATTTTNLVATKLPLAGGTMTGNIVTNSQVNFNVDSAGGDFIGITHSGNEAWTFDARSGSGSDDYLGVGISGGTRAMSWHETGKVGIGATTNLTSKLTVNAPAASHTTGYQEDIAQFYTTASSYLGRHYLNLFHDNNNRDSSGDHTVWGMGFGYDGNTRGGIQYDHKGQERLTLWSSYGDIQIKGNSSGSAGLRADQVDTTIMTLKGNGNVGIGTDPGAKLTVSGPASSVNLGGGSTGSAALYVNSTSGHVGEMIQVLKNGAIKMYMANDGKLGLGTSSPTRELDVNGSVRFSVNTDNHDTYIFTTGAVDDGKMYIQDANSVNKVVLNTNGDSFFDGGNFGIGITSPTEKLHVSGNILATGDITAYSDESLKTNIQVIDGAVGKVEQLHGITFDRIADGSSSTGVIAQELKEVLPEAVHTDEQGVHSVAYGNITGLLIEAIKEQQKQINELIKLNKS